MDINQIQNIYAINSTLRTVSVLLPSKSRPNRIDYLISSLILLALVNDMPIAFHVLQNYSLQLALR